MRWRRRQRSRAHRLTLAEANLRAQCAALDPKPLVDDAAAAEVIDVAALERERLFAAHPRAERRRRSTRSRARRAGQDLGR